MHVIVLNDHLYADGGADVVALTSAEQLAQAGAAVTLFVADALRPGDTTPRRARLVATGQHDLLHDPRRGRAALQGLWNVPAARALRALLAEHDPARTVVHLHSWTKSLSSSVVREVLRAGFPFVCTLHDYFTACPNGGQFDFQRGEICRHAPMSLACLSTHCDARSYTHKLYRVTRQAIQMGWGGLPGRLDEYIAVSRFSAAILRPHLPPGARLVHVRNPIDIAPGPAAEPAQQQAFVMVARLLRHKGQALFLTACEQAGVPAVCVGEGPDLEMLRQRFPQARFTGQLGRAEVAREMRQARALVLPSLWYETQGLVVDEAAALGLPAVVSDACAATDSVRHEATGLLFRCGDVAALAEALGRLREDGVLVRRLGEQARERFWRDPPTPAAHAQELLQVYAGVLARRQGRVAARPAISEAL